ncbi:MAG: hypothetical protein D6731_09000 [Planctomycetota bacterium]|nr:MAG: hypothetical protein D6731_09000 [Planctomycetota bacterium]
MSDANDTKGRSRPRRDPNQPLPKRARPRGRLLRTVAFGVVLVAAALIVGYSLQVGKWPWEWGEAEGSGFVEYSRERFVDMGERLRDIDWSKLGEKTRKLWDRVPELERRLEEKLARLSRERGAAPAQPGAAGQGSGKEGPPDAAVPPPSELELGCRAMRDGVRHYRAGLRDQAELKRARACFERAQEHLERAQAEAKDEAERAEVSGYLQENQRYLYDCVKLEKVGG